MSAKFLSSSKAWIVVALALRLSIGRAEDTAEVQYFGDGIDYWKEGAPRSKDAKALEAPATSKAMPSATPELDVQEPGSNGAFAWKRYLDPKNKEFFKEGDYTPPEPFMEIVRDPSDANLKNWFQYIALKNELSSRLQTRMQEYLAKSGALVPAEEREVVEKRIESMPKVAPDAKRYRFRLYFDSHCPHCKKMLGTLSDLEARGYWVEARQVDSDTQGLAGIPVPVERAAPNEIHEKNIQSVPVLLIGDLSKKVVYRLNGYQTTAQVLSALPKEDLQ